MQPSGVDAPGLDPYVVTVGALDAATGTVPVWSSRGPDFAGRAKPDLVAPGVGLVGLRASGSAIDQADPGARVGGPPTPLPELLVACLRGDLPVNKRPNIRDDSPN